MKCYYSETFTADSNYVARILHRLAQFANACISRSFSHHQPLIKCVCLVIFFIRCAVGGGPHTETHIHPHETIRNRHNVIRCSIHAAHNQNSININTFPFFTSAPATGGGNGISVSIYRFWMKKKKHFSSLQILISIFTMSSSNDDACHGYCCWWWWPNNNVMRFKSNFHFIFGILSWGVYTTPKVMVRTSWNSAWHCMAYLYYNKVIWRFVGDDAMVDGYDRQYT